MPYAEHSLCNLRDRGAHTFKETSIFRNQPSNFKAAALAVASCLRLEVVSRQYNTEDFGAGADTDIEEVIGVPCADSSPSEDALTTQ